MVRIMIGNLPEDVTEEGIQEALSAFAPVNAIQLVRESGAPSAVIEMEMSKPQADALAARIQGRLYQGQALRAWVPIMDWKK
jgi:RNA recognition motif-containing protein